MKEEKWGFNQPIPYKDEKYGELFLNAFGTYTIQSQTGSDVEEYIKNNPTFLDQVFPIVIQSMIKEINSLQGKTYTTLIVDIKKENVINDCNASLSNTGMIITNITIMGIRLTEESEKKVQDISTQEMNSLVNNANNTNQSEPVIHTPTTDAPVVVETTPVVETQPSINNTPPKKKTSPIVIIIIIVCLLALIGKKVLNIDKTEDTTLSVDTQEQETTSNNNVIEAKYGLTDVKYKDKDNGYVSVNIYGKYTYEITDESLFEKKYGKISELDNYKENLETGFRSSIHNAIVTYMQKIDTIDDVYSIAKEEGFLEKVNEYTIEGFKITKVTIESVTKQNDEKENNTANTTKTEKEIKAHITLLSKEDGGRHTPCFVNSNWILDFNGTKVEGEVTSIIGDEMMMPGESYDVVIKINQEASGTEFKIFEVSNKEIGSGKIKG